MAGQAKVWQYFEALTSTKDASVLADPEFEKEYNAFIINRGLSYHQDAVLAANQMNERSFLPSDVQFSFYLSTLRPRKRFSKWFKQSFDDDVYAVAEYYDCSLRKAADLLSLHSSDQMADIKRRLFKGGVKTKKGSNHAGQST